MRRSRGRRRRGSINGVCIWLRTLHEVRRIDVVRYSIVVDWRKVGRRRRLAHELCGGRRAIGGLGNGEQRLKNPDAGRSNRRRSVTGGRRSETCWRGVGVSRRPREGCEGFDGDWLDVQRVPSSGRIGRSVRRKGGGTGSRGNSRGGMETIWISMLAWACGGSGSTRMVGRVVEIERSNNRRHFERSICERTAAAVHYPRQSSLAGHANPTAE
jgi:hypothetical protein